MKNHVKDERLRLNMTQQELADLVNVSRQTINSLESARYTPSTILALKISNVFKKPVNKIFELEKGD